MIHTGVARKWHFTTSGGAANLGGVSGDLFEHRGSGIPLLAITSLNRHYYAQIDWTTKTIIQVFKTVLLFTIKICYTDERLRAFNDKNVISYRVTGLYRLGKTYYLHSLLCNNSIIAQFAVQ